MALQKAHPNVEGNAWRYAVWECVNAQLTAAAGDEVGARESLRQALATLTRRFGPNGFYSLLTTRRLAALETARKF